MFYEFRAYDPDGKKWLHGYDRHGEGCSIVGETIFCGGWLSEVPFNSPSWCNIKIDQNIGIKDKNGVWLFSEDIVKTVYGSVGVIRYHMGICAFVVFTGNCDSDEPDYISFSCLDSDDVEKIGTTHENSELIKLEDK